MRLHGLVAEHQPLGDLVIPPVAVTDPEAARAIVGTALLLTSYGLLALGVGTIVRHSGGTIASGVGGIFLPFLFLGAYPDHIARRIQQFTPLAGMAVQSTTDRMMAPIRRQGRHADRARGRSRRRLRLGARSARRRYVLLRVRDA